MLIRIMKKYGLFDTKENCWIGTEEGPNTYKDFTLARVAAQICSDMLTGSDLNFRIVAEEIPEQEWKLRDVVNTKYSGVESLARIEGKADRSEDEEKIREVSKKLDGIDHLPFWKEI